MDFYQMYEITDTPQLCCNSECRTTCKCGPMRLHSDGSYSRDFVYKITDPKFGRELKFARIPHSRRYISEKLGIDIEVYMYIEDGRRYRISDKGKAKIMAEVERIVKNSQDVLKC